MKRGILFIIVLMSLTNLIYAYELSPSQATDVKITVVNETANETINETQEIPKRSSGSGSKITESEFEKQNLSREDCEPLWDCLPFDDCNNFKKTRLCTDLNNCIIPSVKLEKRFCINELIEEREQYTRFPYWILLLISLLLIAIAIRLIYSGKRKKGKLKKIKSLFPLIN
jgi:hypothetical protein